MSRNSVIRASLAAAGLVLVCASGVLGQVRVSGIEHSKLGGATLGQVEGRRLPVHNLGSSGQDGVEIRLDSAFGGAMSLDLDGLLAPSPEGREIRVRPKGWDGTIKGTLRIASRPPDGTPGSSLDVGCNFAQVGAITLRVRVRDQNGVVSFRGVVAGSSLQCVVGLSPPVGIVPTCRLAIKTKGTSAHRVMSVDFGDMPCDVSGLSSVTLHEVRSIEFEPETCSACDAWVGTESALITSVGLAEMTVSEASLGTFEVSSFGLGTAEIDEECDDAGDCDDERRIRVRFPTLPSSPDDGVAIDLHEGSAGAGVTFDCFTPGMTARPVVMHKWFGGTGGTGPVRMSVARQVDAISGMETITCDASELAATAIDVYFEDSSGGVVHTYREPTAVIGFACTAGAGSRTEETWSCLHGRWRVDMTTPDTMVVVAGVQVPNVSAVRLVPRLALSTVPVAQRVVMFGGQGTEWIDIKHVNDPPTATRVRGINAIAMDKGLIAEQADGSVVVSTPCCDDDNDGAGDGLELEYHSTYGGGVRLSIAKLMENSSQNREIRIRPKGWDGTIKGSIRMSGGGGGAGGQVNIDCNFAEMGAAEMRWAAYGPDGSMLASGIAPGSTLGCTATAPVGLEIPTCSMAINRKGPPGQHRMGGTMMFEGGTVTLGGLGSAAVQGVSVFGFTPVECAACSSFADIETMEVTYGGMESMHVLGASLLTFGTEVVGNGELDVQVGEACDDGNQCEESRKIRVTNLGSSGQDGVEIRWVNLLLGELSFPGGVQGASMSVARGNCCRGHVTLMKLYDDEGQEAARVSSSSNADETAHTLSFDGAASGVEGFTFVLRDAGDAVLGVVDVFGSGGGISYVGPCDASEARTFRFDAASIRMELCESPVTVFLQGIPIGGVSSVSMDCRAGMQWVPSSMTGVAVTGDPTDSIEVSGFSLIEGEPPCAADFDGNGVREVPDIFAFLSGWFAQDPRAFNFGGTVGVPAIFAFLSVWFAGCP